VRYKNRDGSFVRFITIHAFDRQTDTFLVTTAQLHSTQLGKNPGQTRVAAPGKSI